MHFREQPFTPELVCVWLVCFDKSCDLLPQDACHTWLRDVSRKNQFLPGRFAQIFFFERDVSSRDGSRIFQNLISRLYLSKFINKMQCVYKTNYGLIGNIFFIFDFSEQYVLFLFFPKLRGRFTHGTVRANVFISNNFNVFLKGRNKKGILYNLNNITHGVGGGNNEHVHACIYTHIHKL